MGFGKALWIITRRMLMVGAFVAVFILSAALSYYLSRGKEVAVPDMVGKTEQQAREIAAGLGMKVEVIDIYDSKESPGKIIRQFPKAGSIIRRGGSTILKINVSRTKTSLYRDNPDIRLPIKPFDPTPWSDDVCGVPVRIAPENQPRRENLRPIHC